MPNFTDDKIRTVWEKAIIVEKIIVDGKEIKVKAQDVQRHPYKPKLQHIDFVRA